MSRRRCCCEYGNCILLTDDFDDSASSTLSSDWNEASGDWSYDGAGLLVEAGTANAVALTTASSNTVEQNVVSQAVGFSVGDKIRVIANAVDENNYLYMEVEVKSGSYTVRLGSGTGGILSEDDFADTLDPMYPLGLDICLSENIFVGNVYNQDVTAAEGNLVYYCDPPIVAGGKHAGLGNGGTSQLTWDAFVFGDLVTSDPADTGAAGQCRTNQCCIMPCTCCEGGVEVCIPRTLLMTITAGGGCLVLDGVTVYLYYNPGTRMWESELDAIGCYTNTRFILTCQWDSCLPEAPPPIGSFGLYMFEVGVGCKQEQCNQPVDGTWEYSYTCDPFEIIFPTWGPYDPFEGMLCECCDPGEAGWIQMTITEVP